MNDAASFEDGHNASVAIQTLIVKLIGDGLDARSIALMTTSIGASMLMDHYGKNDGLEICNELMLKASNGELPTFPALKAVNQNIRE